MLNLRALYIAMAMMISSTFFTALADTSEVIPPAKSQIVPSGTDLIFVVCEKAKDQGPLDINGFPKNGFKVDLSTCTREIIPMYNTEDPGNEGPKVSNFSDPMTCSRVAMGWTGSWEDLNKDKLVVKVICPHEDGTFPTQDHDLDHVTE